HQKLLRVRDIIHEVRRQLAALERQARAAEQFQALRQEVRRLELTLLLHDYRVVLHEREEADRVLGELALRESAEAAAAAGLASEVETHQLGVAEGEATLAGLREQVAQAEAKLAQAVATLELLAQRASLLDEQRGRVQADIERLKLEQQESTDHLARLSVRLEQLAHELALRSGVAAESEAALAEGVRRQRDSQAALDAARKAVMDQAIAAADTNNRLAGDRARAAEDRRRMSAWNRSGSKPIRSWSRPRRCSRPVSSGAESSKRNWRRPEAPERVSRRKWCVSGISTTRLSNGWLVCRKNKRWRSPVRRSCRRWGTMWSEGIPALQRT